MFSVAFWMRTALAVVSVGVPLALVGGSVWWATRRGGRGAPARFSTPGSVAVAQRARHHRLVGLGAGAAAGVASIWSAHGQSAPALVAIGYLFGVLGELLAVPVPSGTVRTASLDPREARRYLPRWAVRVAVVAAVLSVLAPALFAVLPRVSYGPWSPDGSDVLPGDTLSWPSVGTSLPLAAIAVFGVVAGSLVARRIALLPPVSSDPVVDEQIRCRIGRAGAGAVLGIELLGVAASAIAASGGLAVPRAVGGTDYLASRILVWTGLFLAVSAVVVWCVLGSRRLTRVPASA